MSDTAQWYVVQTKARQEGAALAHLERQRYRVFLPRLRLRQRTRTRIEALFPGYIFVRLDPEHDDFGPIRSTVGVLRMVRFGLIYARVPDLLIDELREHGDSAGICDAAPTEVRPGDAVEIVAGAMAGYRAVVTKIRGKDRIGLLLDLSGRHVGILTNRDTIEPL